MTQKRFLNVHEYVSMEIMKEYGIPVPNGAVATTAHQAEEIAASMLSSHQGMYFECFAHSYFFFVVKYWTI